MLDIHIDQVNHSQKILVQVEVDKFYLVLFVFAVILVARWTSVWPFCNSFLQRLFFLITKQAFFLLESL